MAWYHMIPAEQLALIVCWEAHRLDSSVCCCLSFARRADGILGKLA